MTIQESEDEVGFVLRYGGRCRECGDQDFVCPKSGLSCHRDEARKTVRFVLKAHEHYLAMRSKDHSMGDDVQEVQIKRMVDRFLSWRLPENFSPDAGISFKPTFNDHLPEPMRHNPTGTNLFDYSQAEAMIRHLLELPRGHCFRGLDEGAAMSELSEANRKERIALLRREGRYSGVWFADHLLWAADEIEAAMRSKDHSIAVDDVERTAPFEELLVEAYRRGWSEGVETLIENYPDAEAPHKDAMGEGCGSFMSEAWPNLAALVRPIGDDVENLVGMLVQAAREREAASRLPDCIPGADARLNQAKASVMAAITAIGSQSIELRTVERKPFVIEEDEPLAKDDERHG